MNNFRFCSKMKFILLQTIFSLTNFIRYCIITLSHICKTNSWEVIKLRNSTGISEAEFDVMCVLWDSDKPLSIQEVCDRLPEHNWAYKTVGTLLTRMEKKGAVSSEKINRVNFYAPFIDKSDYTAEQTKNLISKLYNGSVRDLAVSLFKSKSLTKDDINELKEMFDL